MYGGAVRGTSRAGGGSQVGHANSPGVLPGLQFLAERVQRTLVGAQPVRMATDTPILALQIDDGHPDAVRVFGHILLAFRKHEDPGEIMKEMLPCERVEATRGQAHLDEVEGILVVRAARVVIRVLITSYTQPFMNFR